MKRVRTTVDFKSGRVGISFGGNLILLNQILKEVGFRGNTTMEDSEGKFFHLHTPQTLFIRRKQKNNIPYLPETEIYLLES